MYRTRGLARRKDYLPMVITLIRRFVDLHLELVDEVENELAPRAVPARCAGGLLKLARGS
jgi:hypothetical protein